jgi:hypothetical protein
MTEIPDLFEDSNERLEFVFKNFLGKLKKEQNFQEEQFERRFLRCRYNLFNLHKKTRAVYKEVFDDIMRTLYKDKNADEAAFFEAYMRSERKPMYNRVFKHILPELKSAERNKTDVIFELKEEGHNASISRSGCIGYWESFDDSDYESDCEFFITRRKKDPKREKEEEAAYMKRLTRSDESPPSAETILSTLQDGLQAQDAKESK